VNMAAPQSITVIPLSDDSDEESVGEAIDNKKRMQSPVYGESQSRSVHAIANSAATTSEAPPAAAGEAETAQSAEADTSESRPVTTIGSVEGSREAASSDAHVSLSRVSTDEEVLTITDAGTGKEYKVQKVRTAPQTAPLLFCAEKYACVLGS